MRTDRIPRWLRILVIAFALFFFGRDIHCQTFTAIGVESATWSAEYVFWNDSAQPLAFRLYDCDKGPALYLLPHGTASIRSLAGILCDGKQYATLTTETPKFRTILTYKPTGLSYVINGSVGLISQSNGQTFYGISNRPGGKISGLTLIPRVRTVIEATFTNQYGQVIGTEWLTFSPPASNAVFQTALEPIGSVSLRLISGEPAAGFLWRSNGSGDNAETYVFR